MRAGSTSGSGGAYAHSMCLIRLRAFAWVLALVLLTGLAAPVFASVPMTGHAHGGTAHSHAGLSDGHTYVDEQAPGVHGECLTEADCIIGHLGLALPSMASVFLALPARASYGLAGNSQQPDRQPDQDIDPPRSLTFR